MEFSDYRLLYLTLNGKDSETISDIEKQIIFLYLIEKIF